MSLWFAQEIQKVLPRVSMDNIELLKSAGMDLKDQSTGKQGITLAGILIFGSELMIQAALPHYSGADPEFIEGDVFKTIIPLTVQDTNQDTVQDTNQDNEDIKELLEFCRTPRTRQEMQQFMGLNNRGHFRKKILNPLIKGGLLKMTRPDKPTSRNQKYYSNR